jgi:hypothetical protein
MEKSEFVKTYNIVKTEISVKRESKKRKQRVEIVSNVNAMKA